MGLTQRSDQHVAVLRGRIPPQIEVDPWQSLTEKLVEVAEQFELGGFPERDVARSLQTIARLQLAATDG